MNIVNTQAYTYIDSLNKIKKVLNNILDMIVFEKFFNKKYSMMCSFGITSYNI